MMRDRHDQAGRGVEIDGWKLLKFCIGKWWLILLCTLLAAGVTFLWTKCFVTPMYRASVTLYVNNTPSGERVGSISSSSLSASKQLVNTYISIIKSNTVLERVAEQAGLAWEPATLRETLSAEQVGDTELFMVHILHEEPETAARIANAVAEVAPGEIGNIVEGSSAKIVDYATVPDSYDTPDYRERTVMGGAIGCVLAVVIAVLLFLLDGRIKNEGDLAQLFHCPVLGQIPRLGGENLLSKDTDELVREAYRTVRANVVFSLPKERDCPVLAVTSALRGEGRSVTAMNLAASLARTDRRVLVIDCDLRAPGLARLLGREVSAGLCELILDRGLRDSAVIHDETLGVDVVLSGGSSAESSELLGSARMGRLLEELKQDYDYIILDTPPVALAADGAVLAAESDGVLFVARANRSRRDALVRGVEQLNFAGVRVLGFVLNGAQPEAGRNGKDCILRQMELK